MSVPEGGLRPNFVMRFVLRNDGDGRLLESGMEVEPFVGREGRGEYRGEGPGWCERGRRTRIVLLVGDSSSSTSI